MTFEEFPKMARLTRECVITEKIDGTNAQVFIRELPDDEVMPTETPIVACVGNLLLYAGSRTRWITPNADNFGFAAWVRDNAVALAQLGAGRHYGEWWGSGIQRGYGLQKGEKRFSLFNTGRWADRHMGELRYEGNGAVGPVPLEGQSWAPPCCYVVPVLYRGLFGPKHDENFLSKLRHEGSMAAPGFMQPEGVVIYHTAAGVYFKKTLEKDEQPKSRVNAQPVSA